LNTLARAATIQQRAAPIAVRAPLAKARVAFLTNAYPRPSHSFIRREIEALERQGFDVRRWSIRPAEGELPDPGDRRELAQTNIVLDGNYVALLGGLAATALRRPLRLLSAVACAWSMRQASTT
jgi:colanic acid/amylovoran biosynthesis glycosyltransferase